METSLEVSILNNLPLTYTAFAATLASDMAGTIDTARLAGLSPAHLNADDRLGGVQQLGLTATDLTTINALGVREKNLTFKRLNNSKTVTDQYTVTFRFET